MQFSSRATQRKFCLPAAFLALQAPLLDAQHLGSNCIFLFSWDKKNHHSTGVWDRLCCWLYGTKGNMPPRKQNPKPFKTPVELECHWIWGCQVSRLHQVAEKLPSPGRFFHGFLSYSQQGFQLGVSRTGCELLGQCTISAPCLSIEHPASHSASFPSLLGAAATFFTCGETCEPTVTYCNLPELHGTMACSMCECHISLFSI